MLLFTRPRRFGKTLGMSMLRSFFEIGTDKSLFDGLYISQNKSLCDEHMGKYPVIFLTLKGVENSLKTLSRLLYKHYGKKVVILIDEYDVPLDKAYQNGYYHEMVSLIRGLFGQALKTNDYLQFAILTGCLRISKESI